jgi:hypothetical protein
MEGLHFSARATEFSGPALYILVEACVGVSWNPHGLSSNYHEDAEVSAPVFCSLVVYRARSWQRVCFFFSTRWQRLTDDDFKFFSTREETFPFCWVMGVHAQSEHIRLVGFMGQQKNRPSSLVLYLYQYL